jgi:hypothetical protein
MAMQTLIFLILILVWALSWFFFSWAISHLSEWTALAQAYPVLSVTGGQRWYFQSAALKHGFSFGPSLKVCANQRGISLSALFPFRFGLPPFFVPWDDIFGKETKKGLYTFVELRFQKTPSIPVTINPRLANKFEQINNNKWHYVRITDRQPPLL